MSVFGAYAKYYDLLNSEKKYAEETDFTSGLIEKFAPQTKTILDVGCGTGRHAELLAAKGYAVTGVDLSPKMIALADKRRSRLPKETQARLRFETADIRALRLDNTFDVVIALFHVISYLPANNDIEAAFASVRRHLMPGGCFIFDFWYGPGVLSDPPTPRLRKLENDTYRIWRFAKPAVLATENIVDVQYDFVVLDKNTRRHEELSELHKMRYLFKPELISMLNHGALSCEAFGAWLSSEEPTQHTWNAYIVAR